MPDTLEDLVERVAVLENQIAIFSDINSFDNWRQHYKEIISNYNESQYEYYKKNGSAQEILDIVSMESKRFGSISEKLISKMYDLEQRTSTENDGVKQNKKIEIKCARYWAGTDECKWQHLEPEHDYDVVLFGLLDFNGDWKIWGITKAILMGELREKKIVTWQGKQGWWCDKSKVIKYCTIIKSKSDLDNFLDTI